MKKISLFIGALLFSAFFYKQAIGLNLTLFSLVTISVLAIYNKNAFKQKSTIGFSLLYLITALAVFLYNSNLSILANCVAFFTLVGHVSQHKSSIYINWLNGFYTIAAGLFDRQFNKIVTEEEATNKADIDYMHWIKIVGIPLVVVIAFIFLYKNGNPVFNNLISQIDFSFINLQWILFASLGYYLLYNISTPITINLATQIDLNTSNTLQNKSDFSIENIKKENQLGLTLILLLNVLIVFFLITDVTYLLTSYNNSAASFSNQVHNGINALIASIVIAIIIILYFFRGDLNFFKGNKNLKRLAYAWITLNAFLVINIIIKDCQYIFNFGFTYKRIGVLIYLLLTTIGLVTTFIKVNQLKNFWYLIRVNSLTAFTILIVSCTVNWDSYMTFYNLNYAQTVDFNYLINLSNNNTFILKNYIEKHHLSDKRKFLVDKKYCEYKQELYSKNWQELSYDNFKRHYPKICVSSKFQG
ncbi:DUF4153 domain-containing protein [Mariniflexile sp. AS56]|uniref:DUF4153 domain-containing protein n=1 Tax=Mariniflexile sp. AS56 TaxID=3063957 RepID=UPI0026EC1367|nr:DUF4153 domain-containing protein [Mariniflexile sp. AS56]MDO7174096.1 DUF4173 domain-containing protein [Mariniflexile sp. AS56]